MRRLPVDTTSHDEIEERIQAEESQPSTGNLMDSKTSQLDDMLNEKLEEALHKPTAMIRLHEVAKIASEHTPIDLAYAASRLPFSARPILYENLPDLEAKTEFMANTNKNTRSVIFRSLEDDEIADLIEWAPPDEGVWMLEDIPERRVARILALMEPKKASYISDLKKHSQYSAGRLMSNEFFAFEMEATIGEAAAQIRDNPGIDLTRRIFVLNKDGELQGHVPARNLIINPPYVPLRQVMRPILHKITPDVSRDEVVDMVERYKIPALPVVNQSNFLLGVITYEDVVEAIEEITDATFARLAGTAEDVGEEELTIKKFLSRAPWLIVTLLAGLVSVTAMSYAEQANEAWFTSFLFVVPLVTGMSGNVGVQCSTVLVRSMATGLLSAGTRLEAVKKEMILGVCTGIVFGLLGAVLVHSFNILGIHENGPSAVVVAGIVGTGIFGACITASTLGVLAPLFFARLGVDPAIAAGPIVTAFNDVLSTIMYIIIARLVSGMFVPL
ncbi:MAG: magnesium transporter [Chlamydiales bacterium]